MFPTGYFPPSYFPPGYFERNGFVKGGHGTPAGGIRNRVVLEEIARRLREYQVIAERRARMNIMNRLMKNNLEFHRQLELSRRLMVQRATQALLLAEV